MATINSTVGDLAAESLGAVRVFEKYGIDYCCGGKRPLGDVCREKEISAESVLRELDDAAQQSANETDWNRATLRDLIRHIVGTHHEYLKLELPHIDARLAKVLAVHGEHDADVLRPLQGLFITLREELELHLHKEEQMLFPVIEAYESAVAAGRPLPPTPLGTVTNPIHVMEHEHDSAGDVVERMRKVTSGFTPPLHACTTYRALFESLAQLESDLHRHVHLENNVLFPRAAALEAASRS